MNKIVFKYECVICKRCKNAVWKNDYVEIEHGFKRIGTHQRQEWIAYDPEWKVITDKDEDPNFAPCTCKQENKLTYDEIFDQYRVLLEEKKAIESKMEHLRGVCKHEEFYFGNCGDWRWHSLRKICKACGCELDSPNKDDISKFLEEHPNYKYDNGTLTYTGESVDFQSFKRRA